MKKTMFIDDLTGEEAETSLTFGLDNTLYEIDLSKEHAEELRQTLDKYVKAARQKLVQPTDINSGQADSREIRRWAKRQGYNIKGFGRIPAHIRQEWEQQTSGFTSRNPAA